MASSQTCGRPQSTRLLIERIPGEHVLSSPPAWLSDDPASNCAAADTLPVVSDEVLAVIVSASVRGVARRD